MSRQLFKRISCVKHHYLSVILHKAHRFALPPAISQQYGLVFGYGLNV